MTVDQLAPARSQAPAPSLTSSRAWPGVLAFAAALPVLFWHLGRPAFWIDEGATVAATRRSWSGLWMLEHGPDAPLVPFYAVLKVLTGVTLSILPGLAAHPEVLYRWPSAVSMALACGLLVAWVNRWGTGQLALTSGGMMLLTVGVSRYAQEARAYAVTLLLAVIATYLWSRAAGPRRSWWLAGYACATALLVTMQTLAAALVVAHLVATLLGRGCEDRRPRFLRTGIAATAGLVVAAPQALVAIRNGGGARGFESLTPKHLLEAFTGLFAAGTDGRFIPQASLILVLAVIGLARLPWAPDRFLARAVGAWALVPPVVLLGAVLIRPNLLIGRYLLFVVPAWSVLAGFGAVTLAGLVQRIPDALGAPAWRPVSWAVIAVLAAGLVTAELPPLQEVRASDGHGEDVRPAIALANSAPYRDLPIVMTPGLGATEFEAYDPAGIDRVADLNQQSRIRVVWPIMLPPKVRRAAIDRVASFIILIRNPARGLCARPGQITSGQQVRTCLGISWDYRSYRVAVARRAGPRWAFVVLQARA